MKTFIDSIKGVAETASNEGPITKKIENQTLKIPSDVFLWVAGGSMLASMLFKSYKKGETANFVGQWVPTILILGVYNKLVRVAGTDARR